MVRRWWTSAAGPVSDTRQPTSACQGQAQCRCPSASRVMQRLIMTAAVRRDGRGRGRGGSYRRTTRPRAFQRTFGRTTSAARSAVRSHRALAHQAGDAGGRLLPLPDLSCDGGDIFVDLLRVGSHLANCREADDGQDVVEFVRHLRRQFPPKQVGWFPSVVFGRAAARAASSASRSRRIRLAPVPQQDAADLKQITPYPRNIRCTVARGVAHAGPGDFHCQPAAHVADSGSLIAMAFQAAASRNRATGTGTWRRRYR